MSCEFDSCCVSVGCNWVWQFEASQSELNILSTQDIINHEDSFFDRAVWVDGCRYDEICAAEKSGLL